MLGVGLKLCSILSGRLKKQHLVKMDPEAQSFLHSFLSIALKAVVIIIAVNIMGVPMASIVTLLGSCGLAIGLALQGSLSNFAGGIMLLLFHPFRVGDYIVSGDTEGTVEAMSVFYTTLTTFDNSTVVIPNATLSNSVLKNLSLKEKRRLVLTFSLAYDTPVDKAVSALLELAEASPLALKDPRPFAAFKTYRDSSMDFVLQVWVKTATTGPCIMTYRPEARPCWRKRGFPSPTPPLPYALPDPQKTARRLSGGLFAAVRIRCQIPALTIYKSENKALPPRRPLYEKRRETVPLHTSCQTL